MLTRRLVLAGQADPASAARPAGNQEEDVRRLLSMIMLALAAVTLIPAAGALAALKPPTRPSLQRFGVRLVDVPVSETGNPRAVRYIIDYLPAGTVIHRRILILNTGTRNAHFTVYPDAALISHGLFTGDA